ncbi:uncharacterized protein [Leptinotarsa decemlineata]|uniref:uncharacterized protein n=1 Tax=Leptinotarsa decemlineata TaxID=7539 RepID=UPI000C254932|nr:jupiter microtubule associated homolog 1-like [Leptinotarsa decemlineata]XP_023024573.1 jupiter microtubule associated homolog 1-like [Leptinotarsa decemlineata]
MTSTNFNIGLTDNARNSSRVLRPPGGGHTDIFGSAADPQVKKDNGRNASSILEGTNAKTVPPSPVKTPTGPPQLGSEPAAPQPSRTNRVPPGGFSSGLW